MQILKLKSKFSFWWLLVNSQIACAPRVSLAAKTPFPFQTHATQGNSKKIKDWIIRQNALEQKKKKPGYKNLTHGWR